MQQKILVTGATGFIGNYVVNKLLCNGFAVIATSTSLSKASETEWFDHVKYIPFNFNELDNSVDYYRYFNEPDFVIHLAWEGLPNYKEDFHISKNFPIHITFLYNLLDNGLKDLTVTGTCLEYGMQTGCLAESIECAPDNPYAIAKNQLRIELEKKIATKDCSFKWIRLFYMFGKGQSSKSLFSQLDTALKNGDTMFNMSGGAQVRDFLPVSVVAENIIRIATQKKVTGIINNCSNDPVTVKDFVEEYLKNKEVNIKLNLGYYPYPDFEPMRFWGDNKKLNIIVNNE